jgi:hypothetical protein
VIYTITVSKTSGSTLQRGDIHHNGVKDFRIHQQFRL